ncbi:hypothetical protein CP978_30935 [Streptomyces nodosus]|uniref:Uncharacterized protein n=1 Tax=Streptomyces nodosus TaxID=40318 RepID=A0A0B5DT75_9ACTN|nr:hypothetical protein SNOD_30625 [Streptomyces nodosus]QEV42371.1 hypothetical protein CP978_30935 [Streptomyces nodosus]
MLPVDDFSWAHGCVMHPADLDPLRLVVASPGSIDAAIRLAIERVGTGERLPDHRFFACRTAGRRLGPPTDGLPGQRRG